MKKLILLVVLIFSLMFIGGCFNEGDTLNPKLKTLKSKTKIDFVKAKNRDIGFVKRGTVDKYGDLDFIFSYEQVGTEDIGYKLNNSGIFTFEPKCEGYLLWKDKKTLSFIPKYGFRARTQYKGKIDLIKLFGEDKSLKKTTYDFVYQVKGLEVEEIEGNYIKESENSNIFKAYIKLDQNIELEDLKKSIYLRSDKDKYPVKVKRLGDNEFSIECRNIKDKNEMKLEIRGDRFNNSYSRKYILLREDEFKLMDIQEVKESDRSKLELIFSKLIGDNIDYKAYIKIEPMLEFEVSKKGRKLILNGDFATGMTYKVSVMKGLKSSWNDSLEESSGNSVSVNISDINPKLEFVNEGVFLSSYKDKKISFRTMNLKRVTLKIKKIDDTKALDFIRAKGLKSGKGYYAKNQYNKYGFKAYGELIDKKVVEIGDQRNRWMNMEIDISSALLGQEHGVYVVQMEFDEEDALYFPEDWSEWKRTDYTYDNGHKIKHLILSDIGISYRKDLEKGYIFANDIISANNLEGIELKLYSGSGKLLDTLKTNESGMAQTDKNPQYIEARSGDEFSILALQSSALSLSLFNTGGEKAEGIKAFIYGERGVYRPGDDTNLTLIARNDNGTFPENHPVKMKLYNPRGQLVKTENSMGSGDGFYSFNIKTKESDLTGDWNAEFTVGDKIFNKTVKIEEVVPYKIKVEISSDKEIIDRKDEISFDIKSKYLFGAPADGLKYEYKLNIQSYNKKFDKYKDFVFDTNAEEKFQYSENSSAYLNKDGEANLKFTLPEFKEIPADTRISLEAKVLEKSGRAVPSVKTIPVKTYESFVGIRRLKDDQMSTGTTANFEIVVLDENGKNLSGQELEYKIYRMDRYWWWQYNSDEEFKKHFKSDKRTKLVSEGKLISTDTITKLNYSLSEYGEMLIELKDIKSGHRVAYFFRSYWWGDKSEKKDADILSIKTDKKVYLSGEKAKLIAKTPSKGKALLTLEKSGKIIERKWYDIEDINTEIELDIKEEYAPNIYASLTVFQTYGDSIKNDIPIRTYGIIPLFVEKRGTRLHYNIDMPDNIEPKTEFTVNISTEEKKESTLTVAVVDQGLLDITNYKTPNPWNYFFGKEKMITELYDTYGDIISHIPGYVYKVFSLGGGYEAESENAEEKTERSVKKKRFKAVSFYEKPIKTDSEGNAKVTFKMPNYLGAVKVMVVGAKGESYGKAEKEVKVSTDLITNIELPRFLGAGDRLRFPISVFALKDGIGAVDIELETTGPIEITDKNIKLNFENIETKDIYVDLIVKDEIGKASIRVKSSTADRDYESINYIDVKPYKNYIYQSETKEINPKETVEISIPQEQVKGSGLAGIRVSNRKNLNFERRFKYLIRYPYGCIEQTTSSVFPQLYLPVIFDLNSDKKIALDKNINAGIKRLQTFQLKDGSFSYWPGASYSSEWGTNYAGHFLTEAKKRGYYVPDNMYNKYIKYQISKSKKYDSNNLNAVYRFYLLTLAEKEQISPMNYYKESVVKYLNATERVLLAGAYKYAGYDSVAKNIISGIKDYKDRKYGTFNETYGSSLRDKAIRLEIFTFTGEKEKAQKLYEEISEELVSDKWYSTQTTAYSLLAVSKYLEEIADKDGKIEFRYQDENYSYFGKVFEKDITDLMGEKVKIENSSDKKIYITMNWEGIPLKEEFENISKNMKLNVEYLDINGNKKDISKLRQGETFWIHYRVEKEKRSAVNEIALTQIMPAGWEIENTRLSKKELPKWTNYMEISSEEYLDIRDDRISWFFDMSKYKYNYDFIVQVNAVSLGEYYLAPANVQAMYDNNWFSSTKGRRIQVIKDEDVY